MALPLLLIAVGLLLWNFSQLQQVQTLQSSQALTQRGLDLLTNTEIVNNRLNPVEDPSSKGHGHWFHENGSPVQVFVIEFMPLLPPNQSYYAWTQQTDGSWQLICRFTPDDKGYARTIIEGSDGSAVRTVLITRQTEPRSKPGGTTVLQYPP